MNKIEVRGLKTVKQVFGVKIFEIEKLLGHACVIRIEKKGETESEIWTANHYVRINSIITVHGKNTVNGQAIISGIEVHFSSGITGTFDVRSVYGEDGVVGIFKKLPGGKSYDREKPEEGVLVLL